MKKMLLLLISLLFFGGVIEAQEGADAQAVALLFFSPTCPHCEAYIQNELPLLQAEFGDQLAVYMIDVSNEQGSYLAGQGFTYHNVPPNNWGVPMMLIGEHILQGGADIPANAATIIAAGLANGGISLPPIPALEAALGGFVTDSATSTVTTTMAPTLWEKITRDPVANTLAIGLLAFSILSLLLVLFQLPTPESHTFMSGGSLILAIGLAGLLFVQTEQDSVALTATIITFIVLITALLALFITRQTLYVMPLVVIAGIAVALYLAMIELTHDAAACGMVGDCNTVQQSPYAYLFGVIPIGVIGVVGYIAILGAYVATQRRLSGADMLLKVFLVIGVTFSIYLTFLEPFVIGATCLWCLLNSTLMVTLLWLYQPAAQSTSNSVPLPDDDFVPTPA